MNSTRSGLPIRKAPAKWENLLAERPWERRRRRSREFPIKWRLIANSTFEGPRRCKGAGAEPSRYDRTLNAERIWRDAAHRSCLGQPLGIRLLGGNSSP